MEFLEKKLIGIKLLVKAFLGALKPAFLGALKPEEQFTEAIRARTTQMKMIKPALRVGNDRPTLRRVEMICLDRNSPTTARHGGWRGNSYSANPGPV